MSQQAQAKRGSVDGLPRSPSQLDSKAESKNQSTTVTQKTIAATKETTSKKTWGPLVISSTAKSDTKTTIEAIPSKGSFDLNDSGIFSEFGFSGCLSITELNNLLLKYIRTVHELEESQGGDVREMKSINVEVKDEQIMSLDRKYEKEAKSWGILWEDLQKKIAQLKEMIAKLEKQKADLEKLGKEKDDILAKKEKEIKELLAKIAEMKAKLSAFPSQQAFLETELERLQNAKPSLNGEIDAYKSLLDGEKLRADDLEAKIKSLEQELKFKINVLEFELERKRDDFSKETTSIEVRIKGEHAARLKIELRMLRNKFEEMMAISKQQFEMQYRTKITELELKLSLAVSQQKSPEDLEKIKKQIKELEAKISTLHGDNTSLTKVWSELTVQIKTQEAEFSAKLSDKERRILHIKKENERMFKMYEELAAKLMFTKVEVGVYEKLLSPEMNRLTTRYSGDQLSIAMQSSNRA